MDTIRIHRTDHAGDGALALHRHARAYAALVIAGGYRETSPDGIWACEAGDLVLHPPFHLHGDRFSEHGARILNFVLPFSATAATGVHTYKVLRSRVPHHLEARARRKAEQALQEALADAEVKAPARPADWRDSFANALIANPRSRIAALARDFAVTPEHAARAFRHRFGMPPSVFRAEQRLRSAFQALAEDCRPLAEIAQTAGFADQAHMTRSIKAVTGVVPSRVRTIFS